MSPPLYLKRIKGTYYVQVPVPADKQAALGCKTKERSLRTKDENEALRRRHAVIAQFMEEIQAAGNIATGVDALAGLAEQTAAAGGGQSLVDFDATVEHYVEKNPEMPPEEVAKVRRATAIARGSGTDLLDRQAEAWLKSEASKGLMPDTLKDKRVQIDLLLSYLGPDATALALTKAAAADYVETVLNPMDVSKARKGVLLQGVRQFSDWLELRGKLTSNPFDKAVKLLRGEDKRRAHKGTYTHEQVHRLLCAVSDWRTTSTAMTPAGRDSMLHLVALMAFTGARPQELCDVRADAVDDRMFRIDDSKTPSGKRLVPIHSTIAPLVARLQAESSDGFLLSGLTSKDGNRYRAMGKNLQRLVLGLFKGKLRAYDLRGTVTTQLEAAGTSAWVQDAIIGHEVDESTERRKRTTREKHYLGDPDFDRKAAALAVVTYGESVEAMVKALGE